MFSIIGFFGGPSSERDISLDSCRTFFDAADAIGLTESLKIVFVSADKKLFLFKPEWLYSNTVSDFCSNHSYNSSHPSCVAEIKLSDLDPNSLFCSFIHGEYGEDGELVRQLSELGISSFLGSSSATLEVTYSKHAAYRKLTEHGFLAPRQILVRDTTKTEINRAINASVSYTHLTLPTTPYV